MYFNCTLGILILKNHFFIRLKVFRVKAMSQKFQSAATILAVITPTSELFYKRIYVPSLRFQF